MTCFLKEIADEIEVVLFPFAGQLGEVPSYQFRIILAAEDPNVGVPARLQPRKSSVDPILAWVLQTASDIGIVEGFPKTKPVQRARHANDFREVGGCRGVVGTLVGHDVQTPGPRLFYQLDNHCT